MKLREIYYKQSQFFNSHSTKQFQVMPLHLYFKPLVVEYYTGCPKSIDTPAQLVYEISGKLIQ